MKTSTTPLADVQAQDKAQPIARQKRQAVVTLALMLIDITAIGTAFWLAYQLRFILLPYSASYDLARYQMLVLVAIPAWLVIFAAFRLYNPHTLFGGTQEYSGAVSAVTIGFGLLSLFGFLQREEPTISRGWTILSWVLALFLVVFYRFLFRQMVYELRRAGYLLTPTIVVGANSEGLAVAEQLCAWPKAGFNLVGFVDNQIPTGTTVRDGVRVVGSIDELSEIVAKENIGEIIIAPTALDRRQLLDIFQEFNPKPDLNLRLSSGLFEIINTGLRVKELAYVPFIEFNPNRITGLDAFIKAATDYVLTFLAVLVLLPVWLVIALMVRLDSPGPIFYRRRVMGRLGTQFDAFKFRTMVVNGDEILAEQPQLVAQLQKDYKLKDDPRVTRVGRFLRKFSLDELPQFINILMGQMSLVGPRMISPPEMSEYGKWGTNLLTVKPGLTGLWQISGRSDVSYEERVRLDMQYIRNWTIWNDVYILLATIPTILLRKGAY